MLKILSKISTALEALGRGRVRRDEAVDRWWRCDPLGHPALRAMSQAELADLPIGHPLQPGDFCNC